MSSATEALLARPARPWSLAAAMWLNLACLALIFFAGIITLLQSVVRQRGMFFGDDPVMNLPPTGLTAPGIVCVSLLLLSLVGLLVVAQAWTRLFYVVLCVAGAAFMIHARILVPPATFVMLPGLGLGLILQFVPASNEWYAQA